jgi:cell filamentation protein
VNKLDLRTQEALDAFETEIFSARAQEPLPEGTLDFPPLLRCPSSSVPGCLRPGRSTQAAHFPAELNAIHVFREGNGRSQHTFLALLAHHAEHPLKLDRPDPTR